MVRRVIVCGKVKCLRHGAEARASLNRAKKSYAIDEKRLAEYAAQIKEIHELGVQIGIVIGGGNIFRGLSGSQAIWTARERLLHGI